MLASQQQHQYMKYRQNILSNQDGAGDYKTIISKITDKHASSISIHARAQPQQSKFSLAPTVYIDQTVTVSPNDGVNSNQSDNNDGPLFPLTFQKTSGSSSKMFPASFAESGHRKSDAFATASAAVAGGESGNRSGRRASVQSSSDVFFNRKNSIIGRKKSVTIDMAGDGAEAFQNYSMSFAKAMESAEEAEAAAADGASKEYMNHNRIMKWLEGVIIDLDDVKNDPVMAETLPAAAAHEDGVRDDESDDSPNESIEHSLSSSDSNEEEGGNNTGDEKRDNDGSQPIMGFIGVNLISDAPLDLEPHTSKDISMYEIRSEIVKLADDSSSNDTEKHEGNEDTQIRNAFSSWMQAGGIGGGGVDGRSGGGMTAGGASHEHKSGGRQVTIRLSLAGGGLMRRPSDTPSRRWDRLKSISFGRPAELIMQIPKEPGEGYQQLGHTEEDEENMTEEEEQENVDEQNDVVVNVK